MSSDFNANTMRASKIPSLLCLDSLDKVLAYDLKWKTLGKPEDPERRVDLRPLLSVDFHAWIR
jgi:hypothetical protein